MRAELSKSVAALLAGVDATADLDLTNDEAAQILRLADVVTLARTAVERDYRGDVIDAHAPEMPTRFAKQLTQVIRGGLSLGMSRAYALHIATRCAHDSIPPLRLAVLLDLLGTPNSTTHAVRKRLDKPRATVDRELQALHMLGLLTVDEVEAGSSSIWHYSLADDEHTAALRLLTSARNVFTRAYTQEKEAHFALVAAEYGGTAKSGTTTRDPSDCRRAS